MQFEMHFAMSYLVLDSGVKGYGLTPESRTKCDNQIYTRGYTGSTEWMSFKFNDTNSSSKSVPSKFV